MPRCECKICKIGRRIEAERHAMNSETLAIIEQLRGWWLDEGLANPNSVTAACPAKSKKERPDAD